VIVFQATRPDSADFPLFLHVLGAMLLVGSLFAVAAAILIGWRRTDPVDATGITRLGLWTLLIGVVPSFVLMRVAAQWVVSEEGLDEDEPTWVEIGYITTEPAILVLLVAIVLSIIGLLRLRRGSGLGLGRAVGIISTVLLAVYVFAVWAMTTKPD
jgi:hypothetical protein